MKINQIINQKIAQLQKNNNKYDKYSKKSNRSDKLNISQKGQKIKSTKKELKKIPDIRHKKVQTLKQQIKQGTYNVSSEKIAEKIVNRGK